ncbi:mitochondrial glycoprotein [Blastocladiella britannica]|nr:mitochondrial glycoprotein [Blastocladiella britannica]
MFSATRRLLPLAQRTAVRASVAPVVVLRATTNKMTRVAWLSTSRVMAQSAASADIELAATLAKELKYERENADASAPEFLKRFQAKKTFSVTDKPGENEVSLTREYGDEKITITFSIDDVANAEPTSESPDAPVSYPVSAVITITRPGMPAAGAITFQSICEEGAFQVTNVTYTDDAVLAALDTAEADYKRRGTYMGPVFDELDDTLADAYYAFLEERGVSAEVAEFIPEYIEYKEQNEYVRWLEKVKSFVERK